MDRALVAAGDTTVGSSPRWGGSSDLHRGPDHLSARRAAEVRAYTRQVIIARPFSKASA
jgi:hypothetical protein